MFRRLLVLCALPTVLPILMAFRLDRPTEDREALLYDIRAAFVAARADIPAVLVAETDRLVDQAILATVRERILPRTILTIRVERVVTVPVLVGDKREATVAVQAVAVGNGDVIAEGRFAVSVFSFDRSEIELLLAERIATRVATEFKLAGERRSTLATALSSDR